VVKLVEEEKMKKEKIRFVYGLVDELNEIYSVIALTDEEAKDLNRDVSLRMGGPEWRWKKLSTFVVSSTCNIGRYCGNS